MLAGLQLLVVRGKASNALLAQNFLRTQQKIFKFLRSHPGPWIAKILGPPGNPRKSGSIEMWLSYEEWEKRYRLP